MPDSVSYYYGDVKYLSADGKTTYAETTSLVKRTVAVSQARIVEDAIQSARVPGQRPSEFITHILRIGSSNHFEASDIGNNFKGTMTFSGPEWAWDAWTYSLQITGGGSIQGKGTVSERGIQTEKMFMDRDGNSSTLIKENLLPITEQRYAELRRKMGI